MTIFNLEERPGAWFDMEGGGRVQLRTMNADEWKAIRKQTVKKKMEFKRLDGKPERFEWEEVNEDLQNELFWDAIIVGWENLFDGKGAELPCIKENKVLLMTRSTKFATFVAASLKDLADNEARDTEQVLKN